MTETTIALESRLPVQFTNCFLRVLPKSFIRTSSGLMGWNHENGPQMVGYLGWSRGRPVNLPRPPGCDRKVGCLSLSELHVFRSKVVPQERTEPRPARDLQEQEPTFEGENPSADDPSYPTFFNSTISWTVTCRATERLIS